MGFIGTITNAIQRDGLDPSTLTGALAIGALFLLAAGLIGLLVKQLERRVERRLSDVTGLRFATSFIHVVVYLVAFVLYAHIVPELKSLGTALLAGVSVVSIVLGLAAQTTLGNLVAGFSLVLYRPIKVGDRVQMTTPKGVIAADVEDVSLGYTMLRDDEGQKIIVPNSVMVSNVLILPPRRQDVGT
ncbi:MAG: mechanosensitive ion channel [Betaproteobacteria bacterium]|nr:mechanosensitive ion channel [Betaproteobacteria bacterium]